MNSPLKLGMKSQPSSFGLDTNSKYSQFGDKSRAGFSEGSIISEIKFKYNSG